MADSVPWSCVVGSWLSPSGMNTQQSHGMAAVGTDKELSDLLDFSTVRVFLIGPLGICQLWF